MSSWFLVLAWLCWSQSLSQCQLGSAVDAVIFRTTTVVSSASGMGRLERASYQHLQATVGPASLVRLMNSLGRDCYLNPFAGEWSRATYGADAGGSTPRSQARLLQIQYFGQTTHNDVTWSGYQATGMFVPLLPVGPLYLSTYSVPLIERIQSNKSATLGRARAYWDNTGPCIANADSEFVGIQILVPSSGIVWTNYTFQGSANEPGLLVVTEVDSNSSLHIQYMFLPCTRTAFSPPVAYLSYMPYTRLEDSRFVDYTEFSWIDPLVNPAGSVLSSRPRIRSSVCVPNGCASCNEVELLWGNYSLNSSADLQTSASRFWGRYIPVTTTTMPTSPTTIIVTTPRSTMASTLATTQGITTLGSTLPMLTTNTTLRITTFTTASIPTISFTLSTTIPDSPLSPDLISQYQSILTTTVAIGCNRNRRKRNTCDWTYLSNELDNHTITTQVETTNLRTAKSRICDCACFGCFPGVVDHGDYTTPVSLSWLDDCNCTGGGQMQNLTTEEIWSAHAAELAAIDRCMPGLPAGRCYVRNFTLYSERNVSISLPCYNTSDGKVCTDRRCNLPFGITAVEKPLTFSRWTKLYYDAFKVARQEQNGLAVSLTDVADFNNLYRMLHAGEIITKESLTKESEVTCRSGRRVELRSTDTLLPDDCEGPLYLRAANGELFHAADVSTDGRITWLPGATSIFPEFYASYTNFLKIADHYPESTADLITNSLVVDSDKNFCMKIHLNLSTCCSSSFENLILSDSKLWTDQCTKCFKTAMSCVSPIRTELITKMNSVFKSLTECSRIEARLSSIPAPPHDEAPTLYSEYHEMASSCQSLRYALPETGDLSNLMGRLSAAEDYIVNVNSSTNLRLSKLNSSIETLNAHINTIESNVAELTDNENAQNVLIMSIRDSQMYEGQIVAKMEEHLVVVDKELQDLQQTQKSMQEAQSLLDDAVRRHSELIDSLSKASANNTALIQSLRSQILSSEEAIKLLTQRQQKLSMDQKTLLAKLNELGIDEHDLRADFQVFQHDTTTRINRVNSNVQDLREDLDDVKSDLAANDKETGELLERTAGIQRNVTHLQQDLNVTKIQVATNMHDISVNRHGVLLNKEEISDVRHGLSNGSITAVGRSAGSACTFCLSLPKCIGGCASNTQIQSQEINANGSSINADFDAEASSCVGLVCGDSLASTIMIVVAYVLIGLLFILTVLLCLWSCRSLFFNAAKMWSGYGVLQQAEKVMTMQPGINHWNPVTISTFTITMAVVLTIVGVILVKLLVKCWRYARERQSASFYKAVVKATTSGQSSDWTRAKKIFSCKKRCSDFKCSECKWWYDTGYVYDSDIRNRVAQGGAVRCLGITCCSLRSDKQTSCPLCCTYPCCCRPCSCCKREANMCSCPKCRICNRYSCSHCCNCKSGLEQRCLDPMVCGK